MVVGGSDYKEGEETPLTDARGADRVMMCTERERDQARERQEMAGLVGGVDRRMKAPSVYTKKTMKGPSRDAGHHRDRAPAAADGYGYGFERDWDLTIFVRV